MRENYLEPEKFHFAEFTGKFETIPTVKSGSMDSVKALGKFKIHGVEQKVSITGTLSAQVMFARKFLNKISLQLSPMMAYFADPRPIYQIQGTHNLYLALGISGK